MCLALTGPENTAENQRNSLRQGLENKDHKGESKGSRQLQAAATRKIKRVRRE